MSDTKEVQTRAKQELQGEGTRPGPVFRPDVDILERADAYVIFALQGSLRILAVSRLRCDPKVSGGLGR